MYFVDYRGVNTGEDLDYLCALAAFPRDIKKRAAFIIGNAMRHRIEYEPEDLKKAIDSDSAGAIDLWRIQMEAGDIPRDSKIYTESLQRSYIVSDMFLTYYAINKLHPSLPLGKNRMFDLFDRIGAQHSSIKKNEKRKKKNTSSQQGENEDTGCIARQLGIDHFPTTGQGCRNYWNVYCHVAHLVTSLRLHHESIVELGNAGKHLVEENPSDMDGFLGVVMENDARRVINSILSMSEYFRKTGVSIGVLSEEDSWRPPEHVTSQLPDFDGEKQLLSLCVVPPSMLEVLSKYRTGE